MVKLFAQKFILCYKAYYLNTLTNGILHKKFLQPMGSRTKRGMKEHEGYGFDKFDSQQGNISIKTFYLL